METIHVKTVDPVSQYLLRSAAKRGLNLIWERCERMQPQDGFLRVGLSCPFGCMQGPCRIDPLGQGPDRGLCGLERDGMVAALLLRLTLQGTLEALNDVPDHDTIPRVVWPASLNEIVSRAIENLGGNSLSTGEIHRGAFLLQRPMEPPEELILQALRLGVLTLGLSGRSKTREKRPEHPTLRAGYGLLAGDDAIIGVSGQPSRKLLTEVLKEAARGSSAAVRLVSLGEWIPMNDGFLPCVCSSGEAELALSSGRINLLLAGPGTDPSMLELGRILGLPLARSMDVEKPQELVGLAGKSSGTGSRTVFAPDPSLVHETHVIVDPLELKDILTKEPRSKMVLLGGSDAPQQSLGWVPTELATSLRAEGRLVAGWGDAALWMLKNGLASEEHDRPVRILDADKGPLLAMDALAAAGRQEDLKGVCFTGFKTCRELAAALGMAGLGLKVCAAVPIPLWGSKKVRDILDEKLAAGHGSLTHFDHPAHAQEILDWFLTQE